METPTQSARNPKTHRIPPTAKPFLSADPYHEKLTPSQAAREVPFSEATLREWIEKGKLTKYNLPKRPGSNRTQIFVDRKELQLLVSTTSSRSEKVIWTMDERHEIAEEFAILRLDDPLGMTGKLLDRAIEQSLPPERHRHDFQLTSDPLLRKLLVEHYEEAKEMLYGTPDPVVLTSEPVTIEKHIIDVQGSLQSSPLGELVGAAARRIVDEGLLSSFISPSTASSLSIHSAPVAVREEISEPTPRPFRIAIGGFLPKQFRALEKKVPNGVELTLMRNDRDKSPENPPHVDYVIMNRKFIGHDQEDKARASGEKISYIMGGINAALHEIIKLRSQYLARVGQIKLG